MNTNIVSLPARATRATDFFAELRLSARFFGQWLRMPAPGVPEANAELLRLAEAYESTQPSYAADLRAAATMADRETSVVR